MKMTKKKIVKFAGAVCAATGVVALSGLVASGMVASAVVEGFRSAADTMKRILAEGPQSESKTAAAEKPAAETDAPKADSENQQFSEN